MLKPDELVEKMARECIDIDFKDKDSVLIINNGKDHLVGQSLRDIASVMLLLVLQEIRKGEIVDTCNDVGCTYGQRGYKMMGEIYYKDCPTCKGKEIVLNQPFTDWMEK